MKSWSVLDWFEIESYCLHTVKYSGQFQFKIWVFELEIAYICPFQNALWVPRQLVSAQISYKKGLIELWVFGQVSWSNVHFYWPYLTWPQDLVVSLVGQVIFWSIGQFFLQIFKIFYCDKKMTNKQKLTNWLDQKLARIWSNNLTKSWPGLTSRFEKGQLTWLDLTR